MQMLLLDKEADELRTIDIKDNLKEYYKHIKCSTIDITMRKIAGRWFDIICDDEGLFEENPVVTAIYSEDLSSALVGNLIFAHHDAEGNMTALSDEDVEIIKENTMRVFELSGEGAKIHRVVLLD